LGAIIARGLHSKQESRRGGRDRCCLQLPVEESPGSPMARLAG